VGGGGGGGEQGETEELTRHLRRRQNVPWGFSVPPPKPPRSTDAALTSFAYGTKIGVDSR
jgi:hypothetical protein